jgi:hypothetical protein
VSRQAGSIVRGFKSRAGDPQKRAGSRCRYVLRSRGKVKARKAAAAAKYQVRIEQKIRVG